MITWRRGRQVVTRERERAEGPLRAFIDQLPDEPLVRVPGTAIFLNRGKQTAPLAMRARRPPAAPGVNGASTSPDPVLFPRERPW